MAKPTEPVLSATERMLVEKQKMQIKSMRMTQEQLELFRLHYEQKISRKVFCATFETAQIYVKVSIQILTLSGIHL